MITKIMKRKIKETNRPQEWRKQIRELSDIELLDELQRPTDNWKEDVIRESLFRLLRDKFAKDKNNARVGK